MMKNVWIAVQWGRMFMKKMKEDRVDAYSAQSAFYVIMGVIPFFMLLLTLLQFTPLTAEDMMELLMSALPDSLKDMVTSLVDSLYNQSIALLSGTAIAAVWACGRSILAITNGLNSVYNTIETRNYVIMRIRSSFYILALLIALILTLGALVFGNQIHGFIISNIPIFRKVSSFIINLRTIVTMLLLTILFAAMYTVLPNVKRKFFQQLPGAAAAALSWAIFSYGFSIYLNKIHGMSAIYGSLTTIVMVMLWLYFCMYLLFMGAELNYYLENTESFRLTDNKNMLK